MTTSGRSIRPAVCVLIIIGLTLTAYSFIFGSSFKTMDDEYSIVMNQDLRDVRNLPLLFQRSYFGLGAYYRPLVLASYLFEYQAFGLRPLYYYLTNIALHVACALLVFLVVAGILARRDPAFWVALVFAIHPIQWEAVSNIAGRAVLLSSFFMMAAFDLFIRRRERPFSYGLSLLCFALALLSKESAAVFPLLLLAYQIVLGQSPPAVSPGGDLAPTGRKGMTVLMPTLPFWVVLGLYGVWRRIIGITVLSLWSSPGEAMLGFLTFLRSVLTFLRLLILPVDLHFDRSRQVFGSVGDPELWLTLGLVALLVAGIIMNRRRVSPTAVFFVLWFGVALLPVSQLFVMVAGQEGYISSAEHFLYTASIGIFAIVVLSVERLWTVNLRREFIRPAIFFVLIAGVLGLFYLTTIQNVIYSSQELAMLERSYQMNPRNVRVLNAIAHCREKARDHIEAERFYRKTLAISPGNIVARYGLGEALCGQGRYREGVEEWDRIRDPGRFEALVARAKEWAAGKMMEGPRGRISGVKRIDK